MENLSETKCKNCEWFLVKLEKIFDKGVML